MFKAILLALTIAAVFSIGKNQNLMAFPMDLSQFKWKNRLLFLFAPHPEDPLFDNLHKKLMARKAEVEDRDLVIFEVLESGPSSINRNYLDPQAALSLREKYNIQQTEFAVILIGKDGGIKLNRRKQTEIEDIFGLIDAMPMRREEMREESRKP